MEDDPADWYLSCDTYGHVYYSGQCLECGVTEIVTSKGAYEDPALAPARSTGGNAAA